MDAVTYPQNEVIAFIRHNLIPLRIEFGSQPLTDDFKIKWTPTLIVLDQGGEEHHRAVGFLAPGELLPALLLGMAKFFFDKDLFDQALSRLEQLIADYPHSAAAPEALYLAGVSRYKGTHDPAPLKEAYERLRADYPESDWTKRAAPYRLLS